MYTVNDAFSRKNKFHCTLSYSLDDFAHVVQMFHMRSQLAVARVGFGMGLRSRNQAISPVFASRYAPMWQSTQLTHVAAVAGRIKRPIRLSELLARPASAPF